MYVRCESIFLQRLMIILKHGISRGSGERPTTDQDRRREAQRIGDYKGLVESVNARVGESLIF